MNLFEMIQSLCKEQKISIAALERTCGFGNGTIKKWSHTIPSGDRLAKVADYFQVSVDYLLGRTQTRSLPFSYEPEVLTLAEMLQENTDMQVLLEMAGQLSPHHLKAYITFLKELTEKK